MLTIWSKSLAKTKNIPIWLFLSSVLVLWAIDSGSKIAAQNLEQSTSAVTSDRPTLRPGSKGTEVSELQAALKLLGYFKGEVNGIYGDTTVNAVSKFQEAAGLTVDGIAGPLTWKRLFPATPTAQAPTPSPSPTNSPNTTPSPQPASTPSPSPQPSQVQPTPQQVELPTLRSGMRGPAVISLQQRLRTLGFFKGTVDGVFGKQTEDAVKAAQKKFQLTPDGVVGDSTWRALLR
jgi:peptidoglycan hydrolase-like protein with peptidoglycan-binding domain